MQNEILKEALKLLSKRDYFSLELKSKLIKKGYSSEEIDPVIEYLKKENYINDEQLKERYKELAIEKGKSKLALKKKLYKKGVSPDINLSYEEEVKSALNLLQRKYKKEKDFISVVKYLTNRGFSYTVAKDAAEEFLKELNCP